jgi:hypothetical protein
VTEQQSECGKVCSSQLQKAKIKAGSDSDWIREQARHLGEDDEGAQSLADELLEGCNVMQL